MRPQLRGDIVDAESGGGGVADDAGDEGAQLTAVLVRRVRLLRGGGDERADAAAGLDDAGAFELGVDAGHGIGVDAEIDGELADGRQLVAGAEAAGADGGAQPALELRVDRRAVVRVDRNEGPGRHVTYCTNSLEQVKRPYTGAMKHTFLSVALCVGTAAVSSAQTAPMALPRVAPTVDQILSLKRAGSPEISPDGRWVAYTVRETNWDDNAYETEIWLADAATGTSRQLTNAKKSSQSPAWSPDGSRLAFISDRTDKRQIY